MKSNLSEIEKTIIKTEENLNHFTEKLNENTVVLKQISQTLQVMNDNQIRTEERVLTLIDIQNQLKLEIKELEEDVSKLKITVNENESFKKRASTIYWSIQLAMITAMIKIFFFGDAGGKG